MNELEEAGGDTLVSVDTDAWPATTASARIAQFCDAPRVKLTVEAVCVDVTCWSSDPPLMVPAAFACDATRENPPPAVSEG